MNGPAAVPASTDAGNADVALPGSSPLVFIIGPEPNDARKVPRGARGDVNHRWTRGGRGRTKALGATRLPIHWAMALSELTQSTPSDRKGARRCGHRDRKPCALTTRSNQSCTDFGGDLEARRAGQLVPLWQRKALVIHRRCHGKQPGPGSDRNGQTGAWASHRHVQKR